MSEKTHAYEDYIEIRDALYALRNQAMESLELAQAILKESEHPRAVETYSGLLKNVATINSQILELNKTYKDITDRRGYKDPGAAPETPAITSEPKQQNIFIGTTADLQKMLRDANTDEMVDVTPNDNT